MKTSRPNLHLNLHGSPNPGSCGGAALGRTLSNASASSLHSMSSMTGPSTPMDQTIHTPHAYLSRNNSMTSSVATSEDEYDDGYLSDLNNNPLTSVANQFWPAADDELLLRVYHKIIDNPTMAPFVGSTPPSGIIHRAAKDTAKRAKADAVSFPHSLVAIRRRLLLLCSAAQPAPDNKTEGIAPPSSSVFLQHYNSPPSSAAQRAINYEADDWLEDDVDMHSDADMDATPLTPPTLPRPQRIPLTHASPIFAMDAVPLASPFQESFSFSSSGKRLAESPMMGDPRDRDPRDHGDADDREMDGLPTNITSQRKRDSLRFKRGQQGQKK